MHAECNTRMMGVGLHHFLATVSSGLFGMILICQMLTIVYHLGRRWIGHSFISLSVRTYSTYTLRSVSTTRQGIQVTERANKIESTKICMECKFWIMNLENGNQSFSMTFFVIKRIVRSIIYRNHSKTAIFVMLMISRSS